MVCMVLHDLDFTSICVSDDVLPSGIAITVVHIGRIAVMKV
jgi:hypothetical protein